METTPKPWTQVLYNSARLGHLCLHTHSWVFNQLPTLYLLRKQSLNWPPSYLRDPDNTTHVYHQYHKSPISLSAVPEEAKTHTAWVTCQTGGMFQCDSRVRFYSILYGTCSWFVWTTSQIILPGRTSPLGRSEKAPQEHFLTSLLILQYITVIKTKLQVKIPTRKHDILTINKARE